MSSMPSYVDPFLNNKLLKCNYSLAQKHSGNCCGIRMA